MTHHHKLGGQDITTLQRTDGVWIAYSTYAVVGNRIDAQGETEAESLANWSALYHGRNGRNGMGEPRPGALSQNIG